MSEGLGSTRGEQMLGMNSVFMGLAFEDKVSKAKVLIPAAQVEGQRSVIVDPGREPKDCGACLVGELLGLGEKPGTYFLAGKWFLYVQAQQLGLLASRREVVRCSQRDLSKANQVSDSLRDPKA